MLKYLKKKKKKNHVATNLSLFLLINISAFLDFCQKNVGRGAKTYFATRPASLTYPKAPTSLY